MASHIFDKKRLEELLPIMQAWLEGKKIQFRPSIPNHPWTDVLDPPFWEDGVQYRVAPETKVFEWWANLYPDSSRTSTVFHKTRQQADLNAGEARIACIKLVKEFREGDGL